MKLITDLPTLLFRGRGCDEDALRKQLQEATNRIATLEIQGSRLKEERDEARGHLQRIRSSIAIMT